MLKICLLYPGRTKTAFLQVGENEFQKRLRTFCELEIIITKEVKGKSTPEQIKEEAKFLSDKIPKQTYLIALDDKGREFSSEELAKFLENLSNQGYSHLTFVIGGPYGLAEDLKQKAQLKLSCSRFTFTHEMVRPILLEQLYRAFTINTGKKYHH